MACGKQVSVCLSSTAPVASATTESQTTVSGNDASGIKVVVHWFCANIHAKQVISCGKQHTSIEFERFLACLSENYGINTMSHLIHVIFLDT